MLQPETDIFPSSLHRTARGKYRNPRLVGLVNIVQCRVYDTLPSKVGKTHFAWSGVDSSDGWFDVDDEAPVGGMCGPARISRRPTWEWVPGIVDVVHGSRAGQVARTVV